MSEESTTPNLVELTLRSFEAANRRDFDALISLYAPQAVWEVAGLAESLEGWVAIRAFLEEWLAAYEEFDQEPEQVLDLGNGVVLAVIRQTARLAGSPSHARLREIPAFLLVWVDGMVVRVTVYADNAEGRAAAERLAEARG
jgi:ketosteroid isomerase-like protein